LVSEQGSDARRQELPFGFAPSSLNSILIECQWHWKPDFGWIAAGLPQLDWGWIPSGFVFWGQVDCARNPDYNWIVESNPACNWITAL
jgi:hypothetical protein